MATASPTEADSTDGVEYGHLRRASPRGLEALGDGSTTLVHGRATCAVDSPQRVGRCPAASRRQQHRLEPAVTEKPKKLELCVMGPAWLGIGAQRCGTTWFTDLLLQHPQMTLSTRRRKELHALYPNILSYWSVERRASYQSLFDVENGLAGEFTPYYLRALWVPSVAVSVCLDSAPFIVLLRDPVERFASAMRLNLGRLHQDDEASAKWVRSVASDAQWGGMYATQLDAWARIAGRHRFVVLQYEEVLRNPQRAVERVWKRLGLSPVELTQVGERSATSSDNDMWSWEGREEFREQLCRAYQPEVRRLRRWGINPRLWPNFARRICSRR